MSFSLASRVSVIMGVSIIISVTLTDDFLKDTGQEIRFCGNTDKKKIAFSVRRYKI